MLRRVAVDVFAPGYGKLAKAGRFDDACELRFQQSTGDSPSPEVDALLGFVADMEVKALAGLRRDRRILLPNSVSENVAIDIGRVGDGYSYCQ